MEAPARRLHPPHDHRPDRLGRHRRPGFLSGELHRRENAEILFKIRTAILRGHRPTSLLFARQPHGKWNDDDRLLLQAYQRFEDEISKEHGNPLWISRSLDSNIDFVVEEREDRAAAALAEWEEKQAEKSKKDKKSRKGIKATAVPYTADGTPLEYGGLTRQHFREAAIQEQQDRDEGIDLDRDRPETGYNPEDYGDGVTNLQ